jgi:hypothetical protein
MTFIEAEITHNKRRNLNLKEKRISELIDTRNEGIYSRGARPRKEKELDRLRKALLPFDWHGIMMEFIEG